MTAVAVQQSPPPSLLSKFAARFGVEPNKMMSTLKATAFKQPIDKKTGEVSEVSNEEMMALLVVADQYGLNPFTREIYAFRDFKRGGIVPIVGIDGWARIVNEHPQFDGMEFGFGYAEKNALDWAECTIHRKDRSHATAVREFLRECRRDTDAWAMMPHRMMRHRSMIQCARVAFGFVGLFDEEEGRAIIEGSSTPMNAAPPAIAAINEAVAKKPQTFEHEVPDVDDLLAQIQSAENDDDYAVLQDVISRMPDGDAQTQLAAALTAKQGDGQ